MLPALTQNPSEAGKLTRPHLVPEEGPEQGDVGDDSHDGDAAVESDEGVVGAVRQPAGQEDIGTCGHFYSVAGAALITLSHSKSFFFQNLCDAPTRKPLKPGSWNFDRMFSQ